MEMCLECKRQVTIVRAVGIVLTLVLLAVQLHLFFQLTNPYGRLQIACLPDGEIIKVFNLDSNIDYTDLAPEKCSCPYFKLPFGKYQIEIQAEDDTFRARTVTIERGKDTKLLIDHRAIVMREGTR
jgi:hypothetical protein